MATTVTTPMTLEEFLALPDDGNKYEISEGELITMPPVKSLHTLVALAILEILQTYLKQHALGRAIPEAGYLLSRNPPNIRQPDVSVLSNDRIAATADDSYFEGAPDLAVEVVSPSDSAQDLEHKVQQYLRFGAKQVWIVYPKQRRVHVFRPEAAPAVLNESQTLEGGDLLPGFAVKVADLFV